MKDNHNHVESYNRSILFLSLFVAVIYPMVTYISDIRSRGEIPTISNPIYVEIAREDQPPYIVQLDDNHEAREFGETYRLQSLPKNGDKFIIDAMDRITLSRMNARKCLALGVQIGINSATIEDLEVLPGIGPKIAKRIIEYRKLNGTFRHLKELKKVYGIGERKFSAIQRLVSLD